MTASTLARRMYGDLAPDFARYTDTILFDEIWQRPGLSPRDRSLITVASLIALYRVNELSAHMRKALGNGVTRAELVEVITHLAFYAGWPNANGALASLQTALDDTTQPPS